MELKPAKTFSNRRAGPTVTHGTPFRADTGKESVKEIGNMKGRRFLAMLCAVMIFVMNFSGIPALAAFAETAQTENVTEAPAAEAAQQ